MIRSALRLAAAAMIFGALMTGRAALAQPPAPSSATMPPTGMMPLTTTQGTTVPQQAVTGRHLEFMDIASHGDINLVFLGDSITDFWRTKGLKVWGETWGPMKAADFAISGELVQQTLWRVENGELDGYKAKLVVVMIGTNNLRRWSDREIADGIKVLCAAIQKHQSDAKLLLLGIFPRGEKADDPARQRIKNINAEIAKLDDGKKLFYLDIGAKFLAEDGTLTKEIMPDFLHPSAKGYQIWADAMLPKVKELMMEK